MHQSEVVRGRAGVRSRVPEARSSQRRVLRQDGPGSTADVRSTGLYRGAAGERGTCERRALLAVHVRERIAFLQLSQGSAPKRGRLWPSNLCHCPGLGRSSTEYPIVATAVLATIADRRGQWPGRPEGERLEESVRGTGTSQGRKVSTTAAGKTAGHIRGGRHRDDHLRWCGVGPAPSACDRSA